MKLSEVFMEAKRRGMTHARDEYTYHGRRLVAWADEVYDDDSDYNITHIDETSLSCSNEQSNSWSFWNSTGGLS